MKRCWRPPFSFRAAREMRGKPALPKWLQRPRADYEGTRNTLRGYDYWSHLYNATPWWCALHEEAMKKMYKECPPGYEVDHIVPLKSNVVCGLHVPWNLQWLPREVNLHRSNNHWPDSPHETHSMFGEFEPHQMRLVLDV